MITVIKSQSGQDFPVFPCVPRGKCSLTLTSRRDRYGSFTTRSLPDRSARAPFFPGGRKALSHAIGSQSDHPKTGIGDRRAPVRPLFPRRSLNRRRTRLAGIRREVAEPAPGRADRAGGDARITK